MNPRIRLDVSGCMAEAIGSGQGITKLEWETSAAALAAAHERLLQGERTRELGFLELPDKTAEAAALERWAARARRGVEAVVVIGIGGSALGNFALHQACLGPVWNDLPAARRRGRPRYFILDNVDSEKTAGLLSSLSPRKTFVQVTSKAGSTLECLANFFVFRKWLQRGCGRAWRRRVCVVTNARGGTLREIASAERLDSFEVPDNVGGRFSVLSPVGLVSAALCGIRIRKVLEGARRMQRACRRAPPADGSRSGSWGSASGGENQNPALRFAAVQYRLYRRGRSIHVLVPYDEGLEAFGEWFCQLWAESLGKSRSAGAQTVSEGITPCRAMGVTDQHSQLQLWRDGPPDKLLTFLWTERPRRELAVPSGLKQDISGLKFSRLRWAEYEGTKRSLIEAGRPVCEIRLPSREEETMGELFQFFMISTIYLGSLLQVNPLDQPGVERSKEMTRRLLFR